MTARVLVVDDVPANVKLLEARLSAEYFDVLTAASGDEALGLCERAKCDIVLLDVMMPNMDGFEVCRRLKAGIATHHIPVIMITPIKDMMFKVVPVIQRNTATPAKPGGIAVRIMNGSMNERNCAIRIRYTNNTERIRPTPKRKNDSFIPTTAPRTSTRAFLGSVRPFKT